MYIFHQKKDWVKMNKKIFLITGAAGNLGSNVSRQLIAGGESVRALALFGDPSVSRIPKEADVCLGDITDRSSLEKFFAVPMNSEVYVIHCASVVALDPDYSRLVHDVNITGTRNILDFCISHKVRRLVYISSTSAIPELPAPQPIIEVSRFEPDKIIGYYGQSKAEASQLVMDAICQQDLDASIIFPTGIFGPYDYGFGLVTSNIINMVKGKIPFGVEGTFNSADVRDLAAGVISCCFNGRKGEGYIMGSRTVSMQDLFNAVSDASGCKRVTTIIPASLAMNLASIAEFISKVIKKKTILTKFTIYNLVRNNHFSSDKAMRELGYRTRDFSDTIKDEIQWLRDEGKV